MEDLCDPLSQLTRPVSLPTRYDLQVRPPFEFFDHTGLNDDRRDACHEQEAQRFGFNQLAELTDAAESKGRSEILP